MKQTFVETMNYLLARPTMVLGEANIRTLKVFISGFSYGRNRKDEMAFMEEFYKWAAKRHTTSDDNYNKSEGWVGLFVYLAKQQVKFSDRASRGSERGIPSPRTVYASELGEEAIALYVMAEVWEEFLKECPPEKWPYEPETVRKLPKYRSIDEVLA